MTTPDGTAARPDTSRIELRSAKISLVVSVILLFVKFAGFFLTHSSAIFSDALENIVNVLTAIFALYSIQLAHRPADADHPYGHGKIEFFSAGVEGSMIVLAAILIVAEVVTTYLSETHHTTQRLDLGLFLMCGAMLANGILGLYLWYGGKKGHALTLEASGTHLLSDALDSIVVVAALLIVRLTGMQWVDSAAALLVAVYIATLGIGLMKRSAAGLMDAQDMRDRDLLRRILDAHIGPAAKEPHICSYHKLRHRHTGRYHWVDFHIQVPAWWRIDQAHGAASSIEYEIELALGEGNATAHVEPCTDGECGNCRSARETKT